MKRISGERAMRLDQLYIRCVSEWESEPVQSGRVAVHVPPVGVVERVFFDFVDEEGARLVLEPHEEAGAVYFLHLSAIYRFVRETLADNRMRYPCTPAGAYMVDLGDGVMVQNANVRMWLDLAALPARVPYVRVKVERRDIPAGWDR